MKIIINKTTKLILGLGNQALIFSTTNLSGFDQMALDLNSLEQTISNSEIILTLRFYHWAGDWLSIGYHQKEIPPHWKKLLSNCLLYTSPSPRDRQKSRMPSSA